MAFGSPQKALAQTKQTIKALYGGTAIDDVTNAIRKLLG